MLLFRVHGIYIKNMLKEKIYIKIKKILYFYNNTGYNIIEI